MGLRLTGSGAMAGSGASVALAVRLAGPDGEDRVRASLVLVMMHLKERRAVRIPAALRARMAAFASAE